MSLAISIPEIETSLTTPAGEDELSRGMRQRAALFEALLIDLAGPRTVLARDLLPKMFAPEPTTLPSDPRVRAYAADLVLCPDGVWRVVTDRVSVAQGQVRSLEAPALAAFLSGLCRYALGESLCLACVPTRWMGDPQALRRVASEPGRWNLLDAFQPNGAVLPLADLTAGQRITVQHQMDSQPWRCVARLRVEGPRRTIGMCTNDETVNRALRSF